MKAASFNRLAASARRQELKIVTTNSASSGAVQFLIGLPIALIIYLSFQPYFFLTAGAFTAFVSASMALGRPLKRLSSINSSLQKGVVAVNSVFEVLDLPAEEDNGSVRITHMRGDIEYQSVSCQYEGATVSALDDINVTIKSGEMLALVGHSGGGKTTFVNLLPRFYVPAKGGQILIDGININDYALNDLRKNIAYVSQAPFIFDDTILNNVKFSRQDASDEHIEQAIKQAHLQEFVSSLPQGLQTVVGQDGAQLSGGQRQRIALARAFLKDAPILILDEATSALDSQSERYIQDSLKLLMRGRTTIVIAHRLSTIESADRILVMDRGRIVEQGTHTELLRVAGIYSKLHTMQFASRAKLKC